MPSASTDVNWRKDTITDYSSNKNKNKIENRFVVVYPLTLYCGYRGRHFPFYIVFLFILIIYFISFYLHVFKLY